MLTKKSIRFKGGGGLVQVQYICRVMWGIWKTLSSFVNRVDW